MEAALIRFQISKGRRRCEEKEKEVKEDGFCTRYHHPSEIFSKKSDLLWEAVLMESPEIKFML